MKWLGIFSALCVLVIGAVLGGVWAFGGFAVAGMSGHGIAALAIGITLTCVLAVVLMGLIFYSHRSGHDDQVEQPWRRDGGR